MNTPAPVPASATTLDAALAEALRLHQLSQIADAAAIYQRILTVQPNHAAALHLYGLCLHQCGQHGAAAESIQASLAVQPGNPVVCNNYGAVLLTLKRFEDALAAFDRAVALKPDYAEAHNNRGNVLGELRRFETALVSYERALTLGFGGPVVHYNRGNACQQLGRYEEAVVAYNHALLQAPGYADALHNRGLALERLHRFEEAHVDYGRALAVDPGRKYTYGNWLAAKLMICDWSDYDGACRKVLDRLRQGQLATEPFPLLSIAVDLDLQLRCAQMYVADKVPPMSRLWSGPVHGHERIRVGYFSADFQSHPIAYLTAGLFEAHDRIHFEVVGFSFGRPSDDPWRRRLERAFDRFVDVHQQSDDEIARLAREMGIDVAVDLMGFTQNARTGIFAQRCAPVQVNYLGYVGTMGASYMDYVIADRTVLPEAHQPYYQEKPVYLPDTFQANDLNKPMAGELPCRSEMGLPDDGFVFCCFNNSYKLSPDVFDIWMRLLREVDGSVLWLLEMNAAAVRNLRAEARKRGVADDRLVFARRTALPEYLARYRLADLFLDTFHYNAGTTAGDALWAGLPVLAVEGSSFAGRMAASLLRAIGLPELVSSSPAEYESLALTLSREPRQLAGIRRRLDRNRLTEPLFDTARFARYLEDGYRQMVDRSRAGLPPAPIVVTPRRV